MCELTENERSAIIAGCEIEPEEVDFSRPDWEARLGPFQRAYWQHAATCRCMLPILQSTLQEIGIVGDGIFRLQWRYEAPFNFWGGNVMH